MLVLYMVIPHLSVQFLHVCCCWWWWNTGTENAGQTCFSFEFLRPAIRLFIAGWKCKLTVHGEGRKSMNSSRTLATNSKSQNKLGDLGGQWSGSVRDLRGTVSDLEFRNRFPARLKSETVGRAGSGASVGAVLCVRDCSQHAQRP